MMRTRSYTLLRRVFTPSRPACPSRTRQSQVFARLQSSIRTSMPQFPDPTKHEAFKKLPDGSTMSTGGTNHVEGTDPHGKLNNEPSMKDDDEEQTSRRRYIDTMEIFNELRSLGFTEKQSDIILRLINENLTVMLDKVDAKMLSTNELENELYLFEAAQSELRVEIKTSRELDLRSLQNEKATLENLVNEEFDELNKMHIVSRNDSQVVINDQTSENTLLQKTLKKKIQELDNKISTEINSDIKSEIEGLRWHITRSGLMAVLVLVFAIMVGVNASKKKSKEEAPQQVILRTILPEESDEGDMGKEVSLEHLLDQQEKEKK